MNAITCRILRVATFWPQALSWATLIDGERWLTTTWANERSPLLADRLCGWSRVPDHPGREYLSWQGFLWTDAAWTSKGPAWIHSGLEALDSGTGCCEGPAGNRWLPAEDAPPTDRWGSSCRVEDVHWATARWVTVNRSLGNSSPSFLDTTIQTSRAEAALVARMRRATLHFVPDSQIAALFP